MTTGDDYETAVVRAMYLGLFGREPDPEGFAANVALAQDIGVSALMSRFIASDEFKLRAMDPEYHHNFAPPLNIELASNEEQLERLWAHVSRTWSALGEEDPYWSVLTADAFRARNMTNAEAIRAFYDTGAEDLRYLDAFLARNGMSLPHDAVVAEYGCGLGRITCHLAQRYSRILGFDISAPHLAAARTQLDHAGNIDLFHVSDRRSLGDIPPFDLFFSVMVLQHNPPPIIIDILEHYFAKLRPGGAAFFQVPTYAPGYSFSLQAYLDDLVDSTEMEMHFVRQADVLDLAHRCGLVPIEILPDHYVGTKHWVSTTFLLSKPR